MAEEKEIVLWNITDKPIRFVSQVRADPFGGPGEETYFMIMPGKAIDVTILGLSAKRPDNGS